MKAATKLTVALVEANPVCLGLMKAVAASVAGVELVGVAQGAAAGLALLADFHPELAFVSLWLPDMGAGRFIAAAKEGVPGLRVVAVGSLSERSGLAVARESGACGYIPKSRLTCEMAEVLGRYHELSPAWDTTFSPWKAHYWMA